MSYFKKIISKKNSGFTLIEVLIYSALLGIILLVSYELFTQAAYLRYNNIVESQIYQSSQKIFFDLEVEIKRATSIDLPVLGANGASLTLNSGGVIYSLSPNKRIVKQDSDGSYYLSGKEIAVENLLFTVAGPSALQKTVLINFQIRGKQFNGETRIDNFQSAVTLRK